MKIKKSKINFDFSIANEVYEEKKAKKEKNRQELLAKVLSNLQNYFSKKNVKNVYLTGSLLEPNCFSRYSDIDIAIEGFNKNDFFSIYGDLEELLETENIDLIDLKHCHFKKEILANGIKVELRD